MQHTISRALWILCASLMSMASVSSEMLTYRIEVPEKVLKISLPANFPDFPVKEAMNFYTENPSFLEHGFYEVFSAWHDFRGPFWVGAYASLTVHAMVQKRDPAFEGDITTIDGLERYVRAWRPTITKDGVELTIARVVLNGMPAIQQSRSAVANALNPSHLEIFSFPLTADYFLDVGFNTICWEPGRRKEKKWRPAAESLRERIKSTVGLKGLDEH